MVAELFAWKIAADKEGQMKQPKQVIAYQEQMSIITFMVFAALMTLAIYRALKCSKPAADSRALHLLFSTTSPIIYIVASYLVPGFQPL